MVTTMIKGSEFKSVERADIAMAFMKAERISLWHTPTGGYLTGYVQAIKLESGYTPPTPPRHFLVDLLVDESAAWLHNLPSRLVQVYVRTRD